MWSSRSAAARVLSYPALLAIDESGYLRANRDGALLILPTDQHSLRARLVGSDFQQRLRREEWCEILGDEVMAAALIVRFREVSVKTPG